MRRSPVRSGLIDARDRATKRRRARRRLEPVSDPRAHLERRLERWVPDGEEVDRIDLRAYLRDTGHFSLAPEERLQLLATVCERKVLGLGSGRASNALDRIYDEARRLAPEDPWVHAWRGTSMVAIAEGADDGAAELFRRAHCLHDLERWLDAVEAYDDVPKAQFDGPAGWRMDLLVEQRGWCRLRAGDVAGARADFQQILTRYEQQPHLARMSTLRDRSAAVEESFPELAPRVEAWCDSSFP